MKINNKGQIAQTMNWVVATLIIVVVLLISFFMVNSGMFRSGRWDLKDKQKDFVATKSIVNFVGENEDLIIESIKTGDYVGFDEKFKPFLESLFVNTCKEYCGWDGGWTTNLRFVGGVFEKHRRGVYSGDAKENYKVSFNYPIEEEILEVNFWKEFGWIDW